MSKHDASNGNLSYHATITCNYILHTPNIHYIVHVHVYNMYVYMYMYMYIVREISTIDKMAYHATHIPNSGCGGIFLLVVLFQTLLRLLGPNALHVQLPLLLLSIYTHKITQTSCNHNTAANGGQTAKTYAGISFTAVVSSW